MHRIAVVLFWLSVAIAMVFALLPQPPMLPGNPTDKTMHVLAFAVMAALASFAFPETSIVRKLAWLCALGAGIEIAQMTPALHRDAEFGDWIADTLSAAMVLIACHPLAKRLIPPASRA